jgi:hypothetical protein
MQFANTKRRGVDMEDKNEPDQLGEDEEIIELTDVIDESPLETEDQPFELTDEPDDAIDEDLMLDEDEDDFVSSLGVEIDTEEESSEELDTISVPEQAPVSVTPEQVEEALERVIKKMFSEKIEGILIGVIEKAVAKEINRLKSALLEDTTSNE